MIKKMLAGIAILLSCLPSMAQEKGIAFVENKSWEEIRALAKAQNRLIFLDCYTTWCGPCKAMAKEVFPLPNVGEFMNANFVNAKQDMEKGDGIELSKKYKKFIPGYPTYLLINAEGEVVHQVAGYNAADKFMSKIKDGLEQKSWLAMSHKFEKGQRDWPFIQAYLGALEDAYQKTTVQKVTDEVLPSLTVAIVSADSSAYKVFRKYWTDAEASILNTVLSSPGIYRKYKDQERDINEWGGRMYKKTVEGYITASLKEPASFDTAKAAKLVANLRKLNISYRENLIALMLLSNAAAQNNSARYVHLVEEARVFGLLQHDSKPVNSWSKMFAEKTNDPALLRQLLACTALPANTAFTVPEDFRTVAFILNKLGEKEQAQAYLKKAEESEAALKLKYEAFMKGAKSNTTNK
jgi:thiol-disulfide isomerase/thioredoxin